MRNLLLGALILAAVAAAGPLGAQGVDPADADSLPADFAAVEAPAAYGPELPPGELVPDTAAAAALIEAAESAPAESAGVSAPMPSAPLFIGGREVVRFRVPRDGVNPVDRSANARRRITRAAADKSVPVDSLRLVSTASGVEFALGHHFLFLIRPGDADVTDSRELATWLAKLAEDVRRGIDGERTGRTPIRLLISVGIAVLLTIVAIFVGRLLESLGKRWRDWLRSRLKAKIPALRIAGLEILPSWQLASVVENVLGRLDIVAGLLLLYWYLAAVFSLFPWTQGWAWGLLQFATRNVLEILQTFLSALPGLFVIVLIFILFRFLVQLSDRIYEAIDEGRIALPWFHPELARPSRRLTRIVLWIIAFMVAYPYLPGSQSRAVQGVSILLGVMVSLGSTGVVGNILAGFVLTYSRSFQVGDRVRIGDQTGDVLSLGFFSTKVRTIRNEEVTMPNGLVANGAIVNYSRLAKGEGLILHTDVTIGYDVEWRKVHELLVQAAKSVDGIEDDDPEPWVFQKALNDHHVGYELNAATKQAGKQAQLYSDLHAAIQDAFAEAGIEIMSPGYQAIRDGNRAALPAEPTGPRRAPGSFRVGGGEPSDDA